MQFETSFIVFETNQSKIARYKKPLLILITENVETRKKLLVTKKIILNSIIRCIMSKSSNTLAFPQRKKKWNRTSSEQ